MINNFVSFLCIVLLYTNQICAAQQTTVAVATKDSIKFLTTDDNLEDVSDTKTQLICFLSNQNYNTAKQINESLHNSLLTVLSAKHWVDDMRDIDDVDTPSNTFYRKYESGGNKPLGSDLFLFEEVPVIPNTETNVIEYAYSNRDIASTQGIFTIRNGFKLYHTEPKSLSNLLEVLVNPDISIPKHVIMISRLDMCKCCSRLLIGTLQDKRSTGGFPENFFVINKEFLAIFETENKAKIHDILTRHDTLAKETALLAHERFENIAALNLYLNKNLGEDSKELLNRLTANIQAKKIKSDLTKNAPKKNILAQLIHIQ